MQGIDLSPRAIQACSIQCSALRQPLMALSPVGLEWSVLPGPAPGDTAMPDRFVFPSNLEGGFFAHPHQPSIDRNHR
ncbi:hypothetical protein V7x_22250 [Crateriforma conspicua]|uniref:Uncharacterized protein n=1 Tax=Crateriforma conspicua TaxID=2527996 RepID=A0A5C6FYG2_9PLAN|nr:hypothetical protein V7x_22250 [Crateriforma conspicua]